MEDNKTYSVYCHTCPDGMQYFGMSGNVKKRWNPSKYTNSKLFYDAIIEFGWENIKHEILYSGLNRDEALMIEDSLIIEARNNGTCLNMLRSGHYQQTDAYRDENKARCKAYYQEHNQTEEFKEKEKARYKAYYEANKDRINARRRERIDAHKDEYKAIRREYMREYRKRKK